MAEFLDKPLEKFLEQFFQESLEKKSGSNQTNLRFLPGEIPRGYLGKNLRGNLHPEFLEKTLEGSLEDFSLNLQRGTLQEDLVGFLEITLEEFLKAYFVELLEKFLKKILG